MKKTFPLQAAGKDDARVRDKLRHEVNKFVRRTRGRTPPAGFRSWEFECKVGPSEHEAEPRPLKEVGSTIDAVAAAGAKQVYIEIIAVPGRRELPPSA